MLHDENSGAQQCRGDAAADQRGCDAGRLPAMRERKGGSIVNVSSNSKEMIVPTTTYYATKKAALANLTKSAAVHFASQGYSIRVNAIHPGPHETDMLADPVDAA